MENIKIKLSALWAARVLAGVQGDVLRFLSEGFISDLLDGTTDVDITNELILGLGMLLSLPIIMTYLSVALETKWNRRLNLGLGTFFALFDLAFLLMILGDPAFEIYYGFLYFVFTALVAWNAWNWEVTE